jgi:o-succinylbenzoate synthase
MLSAQFTKYTLDFKNPSGTSRGILKKKYTYFIELKKDGQKVMGEANMFSGLSSDDVANYEEVLQEVCLRIGDYKNNYHEQLKDFPSIVFGLEQAFLKLENKEAICFRNDFTAGKAGIPINGLIWMGSEAFMREQIADKLNDNFSCIKMKIGAIAFEKELAILTNLRKEYSKEKLELRVDANGAFSPEEALEKLERLAALDIHSIEQPIRAGQVGEMANLCRQTPLAIALDEELIGIHDYELKEALLDTIAPQYIILKPSLVGGFKACDEWIDLAEKRNIAWWITSALESNVGLDAIAQYAFSKQSKLYQGLGTGSLFLNNTVSSLYIEDAKLWR